MFKKRKMKRNIAANFKDKKALQFKTSKKIGKISNRI